MSAAPGGILALDVSTHVGFCYGVPGSRPVSGTFHIIGSTYRLGQRFVDYVTWLTDRIVLLAPSRVVWEASVAKVEGRGATATRLLITLTGLTELVCELQEVDCNDHNNMSLKKDFLGPGRGNAKKPEVMEECRKRGLSPKDYDEADAQALWFVTIERLKLRAA